MKDLSEFKRTIISLEEIREFFGLAEYIILCDKMQELIAGGWVEPVKSQGLNGKNPPLYKKYRIIKHQVDSGEFVQELRFKLPPSFSLDYYKQNIDKYIEHRKYILPLGEYFKRRKELLQEKMSINERSLDIWGEEKFLKDNHLACIILKNLGLTIEDLNIYKTPEPFFLYLQSMKTSDNLLIIENKDTWYTMRRLARERGRAYFFGMDFGGIIYGEGKKILNSFEEIDDQEEERLSNRETVFFYFGDLDFEGISIYTLLKRKYNGVRNIHLLKPAYLKMVELADNEKLKPMNTYQIRKGYEEFLKEFRQDTQEKMIDLFEKGLYIPQEIINYQVLKKV